MASAVVSAVVKPARQITLFCCEVVGCKQAEKLKNFGSTYHLQAHIKNAHGEPRFGPCPRCDKMFKSPHGFRAHKEKALDCASLVPAAVPGAACPTPAPMPAPEASPAPTPTVAVVHAVAAA